MKRPVLLGLLCLLLGCSKRAEKKERPVSDSFIAMNADFDGFRDWHAIKSDGPDPAFPDAVGERTIYVNKLPKSGSKTFPVGTILVEVHPTAEQQIFAQVKRGGGFNEGGALDWEWFELVEHSGKAVIKWRGLGPASGESYGGDKTGCNRCHGFFIQNDYVGSPKLQLSSF